MRHSAVVTRSIRVLSALTLAVALASCSTGGNADAGRSETRSVETAYGTVEVPVDAQRVVAASYDTPWQLMSVDVTPIATQDYSQYLDSYTPEQQAFIDGLPTIGPYGEYNLEAIASTDPDIIVGDADEIDRATFDQLSTIAPTVVVRGDSRGDWQTITTEIAAALGRDDQLTQSRTKFEQTRDRLTSQYADVIGGNTWAHISLGDAPGQFSVQQPTGATGNLVVNEMKMQYGAGIPTDWNASGYASYGVEQIPDVLTDSTAILYPLNADGSQSEPVKAVLANTLFTKLPAAEAGHVYGLTSSVTDYVTAAHWLDEVESTVLLPLSTK